MSSWILSWFNGNFDVNTNTGSKIETNLEASKRRGESWSGSGNIETFNVGIEGNVHVVKAETTYGNNLGTLTLQGPTVGADLGLKSSTENTGISAMAEMSAAKAEVTLGPLYLSGNLNANTGIKLGTGGVQASYLGFGLTLGVGGRWTIDTPLGSVGGTQAGATSSIPVKNKQPVPRKEVLVTH